MRPFSMLALAAAVLTVACSSGGIVGPSPNREIVSDNALVHDVSASAAPSANAVTPPAPILASPVFVPSDESDDTIVGDLASTTPTPTDLPTSSHKDRVHRNKTLIAMRVSARGFKVMDKLGKFVKFSPHDSRHAVDVENRPATARVRIT